MKFRLLLIAASFLVFIPSAKAQQDTYASHKFSADTVKSVIDDWTKELSTKHPGFYRYNSTANFKKYIDSVKATVTDSLSLLESYRKIKPIISRINCLHTGLSLPKDYGNFLNQSPNLFPIQLLFEGNQAFVAKNYSSQNGIMAGAEILSINGESIETIISKLFALIPADGYNKTMKYRALFLQFPSWYRLVDLTEEFTTVLKQNDTVTSYQLNGRKFEEIAKDGFLKEPQRAKQLEFKIANDIGLLTIHTFSNSDIKRGGQEFKRFIDGTFSEIKTRKIQNLVIDLRDNTGGSDANAALFASYFFDKPFRYWDRIEVTEAIAKEIKGMALKLFYRKPLQRDSMWLWQKARHVRDFDFYEEQRPAKNSFHGKTYVMINGFCMSSCADVAAILSDNKKAIFTGQETGGGYQGNNSGMMPETKMAPFNFTITVPLQKYFNHVDPLKNIGRGTIPDYPVNLTLDDILSGRDKELEYTISLVKKHAN